jgi:hypothetical protein
MILAVGSCIYWGLQDQSRVSGFLFTLSWIAIGVAFVLRHWEDASLKE